MKTEYICEFCGYRDGSKRRMRKHEDEHKYQREAQCPHVWEYTLDHDYEVDRTCGQCKKRDHWAVFEALDDDEWRPHIMALIDPRATT